MAQTAKKGKTPPQKKVPERRCVGCAGTFEKRNLIRVVRSPEGEISIDFTGKKSGRGAYLCRNAECLRKAVRSRALERAFSAQVPEDVIARLEKELVSTDAD